MAADRIHRHILVPLRGTPEAFKPKSTGGSNGRPSPVQNRQAHALHLLSQLEEIRRSAEETAARDDLPAEDKGVYVNVRARPGEPLALESLDKHSLELLGVFDRPDRQAAAVFMPAKAGPKLAKVVDDYMTKNALYRGEDTGYPKHQRLVEGIADWSVGVLQDLWDDAPDLFPAPGTVYRWEVWLRPGTTERFRAEAARMEIRLGDARLSFPEVDVVMVIATPEAMATLLHRTLCIIRVRRSTTTADFFDSLPAAEQAGFVEEARRRLVAQPPEEARTSVCLLDTGVNQGHPLLAPFLSPHDCHSADPGWGEFDQIGHGTEMAGIALFGDLTAHMDGHAEIAPPHRLESIKVVPPRGLPETEYDQLAALTRQAMEWAEMLGHGGQRIYCMASSTSEDTPHDGFPTIWSAEIDQLATGEGLPGSERRLICLSAGNINREGPLPRIVDYPANNDSAEVESPGQAWNALTFGAFTEKHVLTDPTLVDYVPMAPSGDLSPDSRTASWEGTWPIKPELVLEGGNRAVDPWDGVGMNVPDLGLLTTCNAFPTPFLTTTRATSPATADGARMAAVMSDDYPDLWPETIRALLVNSATWTPAMRGHLPPNPDKSDYGRLLRRYGFGVPDLGRARRSAENCLTLMVQDSLRPYCWSEKRKCAVLNEMKLFQLPWPIAALEALPGDISMRITLSYFVEPNPSEAARGRKLRYASHGLRFKVKLPDEDVLEFRQRINKAAEEELGGTGRKENDSRYWVLGAQQRNVGSLHSDTWVGPASDLARCGVIAVHPVGGWWKERAHLERWADPARFSLIVTIDAGENDVDIYTPVATAVQIAT